jgi:hypothetical protein
MVFAVTTRAPRSRSFWPDKIELHVKFPKSDAELFNIPVDATAH